MKTRYLFVLLLCLSVLYYRPVAAQQIPAQAELAKYIQKNYDKREVLIPMRDGVKLFTAIYEPKDKDKYPILLNRTPYTVRPYGKDEYRETLGPDPLFAKE